MKYVPKDTAGMTLLELMFAAGVLALALSLLFGSLISINIIGQLSENRTMAASQLASVLEEVRALPIEELMLFAPPEVDGPGVEHQVSLTYFDGGGTEIDLPLDAVESIPSDLPNPLEIRATLIWSDDQGRVYSMDAVTQHGR
ncbi:MAG: hypothetical protein HYV26_19275 [Candidatus Hydrogenedentes bacterium]|nr:hypothetical protein [Candidatus Hydrogenedentota bacterium]MBI3118874.1 hypothetical protein [Candidatus Hydrogenedentota bacterium]